MSPRSPVRARAAGLGIRHRLEQYIEIFIGVHVARDSALASAPAGAPVRQRAVKWISRFYAVSL